VPTDLVPHVGKKRIQFTLNTSVESEAKRRALPHLEHWHKRFAELRSANGLIAETPNAGALDTTGWTWPDWEALVSWLEARLLEDDLEKRLRDAKGLALLNPAEMPRLGREFLEGAIARKYMLEAMTPAEYANARLPFLQKHVSSLGVRLTKGGPYFDRIMAACLAMELRECKQERGRENNRTGFHHAHPDTIAGPWRRSGPQATTTVITPNGDRQGKLPGHSLTDCLGKWKTNRERAKNPINKHLVDEVGHQPAGEPDQLDVALGLAQE
jgi:hypothetical protein